ncbi:penicillin-binding protein activator [Thioclava atlantica]|uniref:Extracellular ligand-binding receptor family protein n=1 Tax=Thioclava atlantica TaxID=1317124 RepID=A0A085U180_9RHOB|nr:penicillin-binding protein activator [Thioclava atlantica]KFE36727.1 extracellular ligand-binding receptor family protein [Thioclava atlantica]
MFDFLRNPRALASRVIAVFALLWLAACQPGGMGNTGQRIDTSAPVKVALLVPAGSGNSGDETLARALQNAANMAIADLQGVRIDLQIYNTAGQPAQAAAMATKAVDNGAKIILGPVYAQSANAVGLAVASRNVNVLSFSNNTDIAGGNVFVLGPTFPNTANRLVSYAARQGKRRIMVVHEQTTAGEVGAQAIQSAIARNGASLAGVSSYPFSQQGVVDATPQIATQVKSGNVDALFLTADTAGALPLLTQLLSEQGVSPATTQYLGLTRWDIPPATLALPGVQGGWFAEPDPGLQAQFVARYQAAYGSAPHPIAGLAYDGIAAIGALVKSGNPNALTKQGLTQPSGFVGVNGVFRLLPDGSNERGLAVAQVQNGQAVVVDPAPRSFAGAGF